MIPTLILGQSRPPLAAVLVGLALLLAYAALAAAEAGLFSLRPLDRSELRAAGFRSVDWLLERPRRTLATLLLAQDLLAAGLVVALSGPLGGGLTGTLLAALVAGALIVPLGDVAPKALARRASRPLSGALAPLVRGLYLLLGPLRRLLVGACDLALGLSPGMSVKRPGIRQEEQLRALLDNSGGRVSLAPMEQQVIRKVFQFGDLTVGRLMTPRPDMSTANLASPWPELIAVLREAGYSRMPVWEGSPDNIIGVLMVKDLLPHLPQTGVHGPPSPRQIRALLRPPHFAPPTRRADDMLAEFRAARFHMALIVDEYGSVVGLVTLDDLLGELVGELLDETDVEETAVFVGHDGHARVRGTMDVGDFAEHFEVSAPEGDFHTVGGFAIATLGELASEGREVMWQGLRLTVERMDGRRVGQLRVEVLPLPEEAE